RDGRPHVRRVGAGAARHSCVRLVPRARYRGARDVGRRRERVLPAAGGGAAAGRAGRVTAAVEGFVPFHGHRTWYRMVGERAPGRLPLLCLHGGPGSSSAYHERLEALAED